MMGPAAGLGFGVLAALGVRRISTASTLALAAWTGFVRATDKLLKNELDGFDVSVSYPQLGGLLAGLAVLALLLPFVESGRSASLWLLLPGAALLTALWLAWEVRLARTGGAPMVDLHIVGIASFRNGLAIQTIYFLGMTSVWVLVALYVQESAGFSALQAGLLAMPPAVAAALAAHWAGRRVTDVGR